MDSATKIGLEMFLIDTKYIMEVRENEEPDNLMQDSDDSETRYDTIDREGKEISIGD